MSRRNLRRDMAGKGTFKMDAISQYIHGNLDVIYFLYGLAFVVMGIVILLQPKKDSGFPLEKALYLLGWFGLIHGTNEFLDMWLLIKHPESAAFDLARLFILVISYLFLFEFGRRIIRAAEGGAPLRLMKATRFLTWQILPAIVILITVIAATSSNFTTTSSILSRYLLGFPGAILTGLGLLSYHKRKAGELKISVRNYFMIAGFAFMVYGAISGLITPKGDFFPANLFNIELFFSTVGLPVQLFRTVCAILISWGITGALKILNWERDEIMQGVVFNNSQDCIANISLEGEIIAVNKAGLLAYEISAQEEIIGKTAATNVTENAQKLMEAVNSAVDGKTSSLKYKSTGNQGREVWWDSVISPVKGIDNKIKSVLYVSKDITAQLASREKLTRTYKTQSILNNILRLTIENDSIETFLGQALEHIFSIEHFGVEKKGAVFLTDAGGANLILRAQRGLPETITRRCADVPFGHCLCGTAALSGKTVFAEDPDERHEIAHEGMTPHGHYCLPIKTKDKVIGVLTIYVRQGYKYDENEHVFLQAVCSIIAKTVEYKNMEEKAFQVQKMESLGRFAGAIAHDFNNILTGIKGFTGLALETLPENSEAIRYVKETASGIDKGADLIQQILSFSRNQPAEMNNLDINKVIAGMEPILRVLLEKKIRLKLSLAQGLPEIKGNKGQLEQVIVNLAVNARYAMAKGGELSIKTTVIEPEKGDPCPADFMCAGQCRLAVKISIADTGCGIPINLIEHIFEPFFTTKPEGEGTGLGLSTAYSLVKLHKGGIGVTSRVDQGTTLDICFPALTPEM